MEGQDPETDYALKVIEELRNKRFRFRQEPEPNGKKYVFIVSNNDESSDEQEQDIFKQVQENVPQLDSSSKPRQTPPEESSSNPVKYVPKNLIKNFVCAFSNFIHDTAHETTCLEALGTNTDGLKNLDKMRSHLKGLLKAKKFNTPMLEHLLSMNEYKILFRLFLAENAREWIQKGRMEEKEIYNDTIRYLQSYIDGDTKGRLKFSYKR